MIRARLRRQSQQIRIGEFATVGYNPAVINPLGFRELVSGRRRGLGAAMARAALRAAEAPYTAAVCWRNRCFDSGRTLIHRLPVPVMSVGNLTLGGTGKTPLVEWLARWFQARGVRVALVSRGYRAQQGTPNDEARELAEKLPDVPHFQNPDRVLAGNRAIAEAGAEVIVLDDAFQHRRLARDLDIVLIDACEPFGFGHVFPRGTLREPLAGCRRAQIVALSRADMISAAQRATLWKTFEAAVADSTWNPIRLELGHAPRCLRSADGLEHPMSSLAGQQIAAFSGIGNPAGFRHVLAGCGYDVVEFREFPDHHAYSERDIDALSRWANELGVAAVVCTHKDLVKLPHAHLGRVPLWALTVGIDFLTGQVGFESQLAAVLARMPNGTRNAA